MADNCELTEICKTVENYRFVAVVGGGGKTSLIFYLAEMLSAKGKKVIVATSTHMAADSQRPFALWGDEKQLCKNLSQRSYSVAGILENATGKVTCPADPDWTVLSNRCDLLLVEADGAHGLPLKVPADHEPVIPEQAQLVIGVAGLDVLGQTIEKGCHRPRQTAALLGQAQSHRVTEEDMAAICVDFRGLRKGVGRREFRIVLNKADDEGTRKRGEAIRKKIRERSPGQRVGVVSLKQAGKR